MANQSTNGIPNTNNSVTSITRKGQTEPFDLQIARGQIFGHSTVNIYGYNPSVTTSFIPLWENATAYTYPVSATKMHLSGSAGDTAVINIVGLDANYNSISELLTLNGTTAVTTAKTYFRINNMLVASGSSTNPSGVVTLKDLTDTTIYAQINAGIGRTQSGIYTVPAGSTFYLSRIDGYTSFNGNTINYTNYRNYSVSSAGVVSVTQQSPFTQFYHAQRIMPRPFAEKTDIQIQASTSASTAVVSISFEGYLISNGS